ncbi:MAG: amidohydrolase family protein [Balneolaceae bacterium]|nr:amidohydrolase family protein [Balneolaceae bacterium]
MKKRISTGCLAALLITAVMTLSAKAQIPEKPEFGKFAITNVTIHTVTDGVIENGVVLIEGERIAFVGKNAKITPDYQQVDGTGKHLYPGFMDSRTQLGLQEIGSVAVTRDQAELGSFNPHVMAFTAINPSSVNIPVTRVNGVTHVISNPVSGRLSGKSTLIDLYGYSPDSMAILKRASLHLNWPSAVKRGWWDDRKPEKIQEQYEENLKELNDFWNKAKFYHRMVTAYEENPSGKTKPEKDEVLDAMREVVTGSIPVVISVNRKKNIENAINWAAGKGQAHFILSGVREGWRVADKIAESGIPCLVSTLHTPVRDYDNYQRPYQNPGKLHEAGVKIAFATGEVENVRNVLYHAGYGATYGLGREEAIRALTINPAEIFGVSEHLGSIEEGKQANLFIADGDPLEPMTHIEQVFIRGYKVPMVSRHTQLYEEFLNRGPDR